MDGKGPEDIDELNSLLARGCIDASEFVSTCVKILAERVGCQRAGLWCIDDSAAERTLRSVRLYDRVEDKFLVVENQGEPLVSRYVAAFEQAGTGAAFDLAAHPATRRVFEDDLAHTGVRSVMAKAFALNGDLLGAFKCAHVGGDSKWTPRQFSILTKISSSATLTLARAFKPLHSVVCHLPPLPEGASLADRGGRAGRPLAG